MEMSRRDCLRGIGAAGIAVTGATGARAAEAGSASVAGVQPIVSAMAPRLDIPERRPVGPSAWISAEDFADPGGWRLDSQFVHLMGSSYLIARSVGTPVDDAVCELGIPEAGRYRVWARTRDWLPAYHPGTFQIALNGEPLPKVLGEADTDAWRWVIAGDADLDAGIHRLALHDLSGGFGRCAAIIVTTDIDYVPPHDVDAVMRERLRLRGLEIAPRDLGHFEVAVIGGGPAGCPAAIASARMHARTALIHDRPVLGGNASSELGVPPEGAALIQRNGRETGIIEEATRLQVQQGLGHVTEPFAALAAAEPDLTVFLHTRILGVEMAAPGRIGTLHGIDVRDGAPVRLTADCFIDCTGDGWIGYFAGAEYRIGWEARWQHDEPSAPEQADLVTMSGTLMGPFCFWAEDVGEPTAYTPPPWAAELPDLVALRRTPSLLYTGEWWLETPGDRDDLNDTERVRDELIRISFGYFHYIKNVWAERERTANLKLVDMPHMLAKRETRRLVGDYMLTMNDVMDDTQFPDAVAYTGWPMDIHNPAGIYGGPEGPYYCNHLFEGLRQIPFGSLYATNVENLLMAGRCAGVTRLALGTVRVERTLATMGQAAGTAAALCVERGWTPRRLRNEDIGALQQALLKHDLHIPGIVNQDPEDLARTATVTASSVAAGDRIGPDAIRPGKDSHPMDGHRRALMLPVMHGQGVQSVSLLLLSDRPDAVDLRLHLREATGLADFASTRDIAVADARLPGGGEHWVDFTLNAPVDADYAWVWLEAAEGVSWRLAESLPWVARAYAVKGEDGADAWVPRPEGYAFRMMPEPEIRMDYGPGNVINGANRILDGATPNMWRSDPGAGFPQWIELAFPKPVTVNTVHLAWVTDLNSRRLSRAVDPDTGAEGLPCVSDYEIQARVGDAWVTQAQATGNFQRFRRRRFDDVTTQRLRVLVTDVFMMDSAQLYEIRAYRDPSDAAQA